MTELRAATPPFAAWRFRGLGLLRIAFGLVWAADAYFKWQPGFHENLDAYLAEGAVGQPAAVRAWIEFWIRTIGVRPHFYAYVVAFAETAIAFGLIAGVLSNITYVGGTILSLGIWSTAEGFGGPYQAGSTDIGAGIIYAIVFAGLFLASAGNYLGLDAYLTRRLGRWCWLASGPVDVGNTGGA